MELTILHGSTFCFCDALADTGSAVEGVYAPTCATPRFCA
jgi:hypothetical protein